MPEHSFAESSVGAPRIELARGLHGREAMSIKLSDENPDIGLSNSEREKSCTVLGSVLADQHVLYLKLRNYHWNLTGVRFHTLHAFYEEQYTALAVAIDETAEHIRMLGGVSPGSMKEMLEGASLDEAPGALIDGTDSLRVLVSDNEKCATALRGFIEEVDDEGTKDFLTGLLQSHEQTAWMLRSFLR